MISQSDGDRLRARRMSESAAARALLQLLVFDPADLAAVAHAAPADHARQARELICEINDRLAGPVLLKATACIGILGGLIADGLKIDRVLERFVERLLHATPDERAAFFERRPIASGSVETAPLPDIRYRPLTPAEPESVDLSRLLEKLDHPLVHRLVDQLVASNAISDMPVAVRSDIVMSSQKDQGMLGSR